MRHVYVVTRIPVNNFEGGVSVPNLGVHTSLQKAERHFDSVVKDRQMRSKKKIHVNTVRAKDMPAYMKERMLVLSTAYVVEPEREEVRLERWELR
jgi:hypothetical protein